MIESMSRKAQMILVGLAMGGLVLFGSHRLWSASSPWAAQYAPTKLDWLALTLQASDASECTRESSSDYCIGRAYRAHSPGHIWIFLTTRGSIPLSAWDSELHTAEKFVRTEAQARHLPSPELR